MDRVKILYVINGGVKSDILTASEISINRQGGAVSIDFPNADGVYLMKFSKPPFGKQDPVTWVSYAQADWVSRSKSESDTPTELS